MNRYMRKPYRCNVCFLSFDRLDQAREHWFGTHAIADRNPEGGDVKQAPSQSDGDIIEKIPSFGLNRGPSVGRFLPMGCQRATEITPAMEEAGAEVLWDLLGEDVSNEVRARRVYAAMWEASSEASSIAKASPSSVPKSR